MHLDRPIDLCNYALQENEVHIWRTGLDIAQSDLVELRQVLSPHEQERVDRFHFEADRRRCAIGRGTLRLLLGAVLKQPASKLQFEYDDFGKPHLIQGKGSRLRFNVSHSGGLILLAITIGRMIGVDVEMVRTDLDLGGIAARFFSVNEYTSWASLADDVKHEAFFACWTRKEAYLKARGAGLSMATGQFDVSFLSGEAPQLLETRPDPDDVLRWSLRAPRPEPGYAAALAVEGSGWTLKCLDFQHGAVWE